MKILNFNMVLGYLLLSAAVSGEVPLGAALAAVALNLAVQPAHFFAITLKSLVFGEEKSASPTEQSAVSRAGGAMRRLRNGADYGLFMLLVFVLLRMDVFVWVYLGYGFFYAMLFVGHMVRTFLTSLR